ncbi:MAG: nucleotide exchange factor GrpE, partial [archaeon]
MADNEGTDSPVETEPTDDAGDPDADASPNDEQDSRDPSAAAGDGEVAETDVEADTVGEAVTDPDGDETDVGGVVEDERELIDRVAEHDEDLGDAVSDLVDWTFGLQDRTAELESEVESLESEVEELEATVEQKDEEIEDLTSRLKRKQADFQNYKKRAKKRQEGIKDRATEDLVERLVDVRNDLVRAIESDHEDVESLREGVEMILREFDRVLDDEGVEEIDPDPGETVDPQRHEVMMQVDSARPEGAIHDVYDSGYEMGGKVLQPARVTVSNGADHDPEGDDGDSPDDSDDSETDDDSADSETDDEDAGDDSDEEDAGDEPKEADGAA